MQTRPNSLSHTNTYICTTSDLEFALTLSIDWVALSFVQKPEDILELRELAGPNIKVRKFFTSVFISLIPRSPGQQLCH